MGRRRVLVSVYGSGGDLFPLVPLVLGLREAGHDVRCAVPRTLGLYLRPQGLHVYPLGRGAEVRVLDDQGLVSTRFDGWYSVRRLAQGYVGETVVADVAAVEEAMAAWRPDLVVTATSAAAARIAAFRRGIPRLDVSIYPSVLAKVPGATRFAARYRRRCAELAGLTDDATDAALVTELAWGVGPNTVLLHDPGLLGRSELAGAPLPWGGDLTGATGFPQWDDAQHQRQDVTALDEWLGRSDAPSVIVTMGSYLGARRREAWTEVASAIGALGVRAAFLGPRRELTEALSGADGDCLVAGYVPLSRIAGQVSAIVHHGGLGTMFAALRAGTPAVVVPRAFDQPFNARLVEAVGAGLASRPGELQPALASLLARYGDLKRGAEAVGQALVPGAEATARAVARVGQRLEAGTWA